MLRPSFVIAVGALLVARAVSAAPPTTYYRSIGSAPNYTTGTVTAVNGETYVVGSLGVQWKTANHGRGDSIDIGGTPYTIFSVDAENELTLTQPYAGATTFTQPYTISRKFGRLEDWEECIQNLGGCFGVSTPSLVADDRIEVGVVYKDAVYLMNGVADELDLENVLTDAVHTITLTVTPPNRHHGVLNTGVILENGPGAPAIRIRTDFVTIEWIELHRGDTDDQIRVDSIGGSSEIVVRNVLFYDDDNTAYGFHVNDDDANVLFYNNILYGLDHGVHVDGLQPASNGLFKFYHNTFFQNRRGLHSTTSTPVENDVIVMNGNLAHSSLINPGDFDVIGIPAPPSANNWSGDGTGFTHGGVGGVMLADIQFVSTTPPEDLHIKRGSIVEDQGSAIAAVSDDIDGRPRGTPDVGADEADTSSANPVKILTAKSASNLVQLEWQHPDFGPMEFVEVHRSSTAFPTQPSVFACSDPITPAPGTKGQCADSLPRINGTSYFYSAFVFDKGGNFSKEASVKGRPFDTGAVPPAWTYATKMATLEPAGVRGSNAFVVSNDKFFHAMQGGPTGGEWPSSGWAPYKLPVEVQHRPVIVTIAGNPTALLGAQDGRVYAVDIGTGRLVWKSQELGGPGASINAAPAALVRPFAGGGGADHVFVGTSNLLSNSLFVLDLFTGDLVKRFDDVSQPENIGAITGVAVKYPSGPVFFTSADGSGAANRNVWSIDVNVLPATPTLNWADDPGPIDAGPTLYQNRLFVGSQAGELIAYDAVGPAPPLWVHPLGDGPLKAPIFPVFSYDTLLVSTNDKVHSVQFTASGCGGPPCTNWTENLFSPASPILYVPGTDKVYVGLGNGDLREFTFDRVVPMNPRTPKTWTLSTSVLGGPAFSVSQLMLYVSDSSGKVHGIPWPP